MAYFGGVKSEKIALRVDAFGVAILVSFLLSIGILVYVLSQSMFRSGSPVSNAPMAAALLTENLPSGTYYQVLVPIHDIRVGEKLVPEMFQMKPMQLSEADSETAVRDWKDIFGQYARTNLAVDTPLLSTQLSSMVPTNELTAKIPSGSRAVTISVDGESGVEGWVRPGARVDVVWTTEHLGRALISTIVENIEVLSVERSTEKSGAGAANPKTGRSHVTLLVRTGDAQKIQLAKTSGTLSLNLRGDVDGESVGSDTITVDRLIKKGNLKSGEPEGRVVVNGKTLILKDGELVNDETNKPLSRSQVQ